jgi:hypothetical protein
MNQMAVNQSASGTRLRSKIVPAVTDTLRAQPAQLQRPSGERQPFSLEHFGQWKPFGQRKRSK